jgi:pimeloyl-ACP methyl ester carboxylesterase
MPVDRYAEREKRVRSIKLTVSVAVAALTLGTIATPALANRPADAGNGAERSASAQSDSQPGSDRMAPGASGAERAAEARGNAGGDNAQAGGGQAPDWQIDQQQVDSKVAEVTRAAVDAGIDTDTVTGEIAGAAYIGQKPADWNGDLVVWAHGFRGEGPALTVDAPPAYVHLLDEGYAWIASSYRRNSYDPGIGVLDTKNATVRAAELFGQPERTYLAGASMGGHVTAAAIERFPQLYDGALPVCGVMADVELFDYFLDYNLGAAAIAGLDADELTYPDDDWVNDEVVDIKAALSVAPAGVPGLTASWALGGSPLVAGNTTLNGDGQRFKDFIELASGGERVGFDLAWDFWHVLASPTGDFFFELGEGDGTIANRSGIVAQNVDRDYVEQYGPEFEDVDEDILRVTASNRVRKAQGQKPAPLINGTPSMPVLTMHTTGDLFVPIQMQLAYAERVASNGLSDNLVQRAIRDVGHCTFNADEWVEAYDDLFTWVEDGVRPAGEDLIDDIGTAAVGCDWTRPSADPLRSLFPPCGG